MMKRSLGYKEGWMKARFLYLKSKKEEILRNFLFALSFNLSFSKKIKANKMKIVSFEKEYWPESGNILLSLSHNFQY